MARRPYVTGTHDANDALWGYCHIWLADGTVVKFWQATGRWDGKWRWEAGSKSGLADSIEAGREAAAKALGVSFEMSPERFTKIMGWDRAPTPREPAP